MLDKFSAWSYRDNNNCWHFVRQWQIERCGVPESALPSHSDISPNNKHSMTKAAYGVMKDYILCKAEEGAIACMFKGKALIHVGVVFNGQIAHACKSRNRVTESIKKFAQGQEVRFYKYANA